MIYYFRREQLNRITEQVDKSKVENIDVFYSYGSTLLLVILIIMRNTDYTPWFSMFVNVRKWVEGHKVRAFKKI